MAAEEEVLEEEDSKKKKKEKKKKDKKGANFDATVGDDGAMYTDADSEDDEGGGFMAALIILFIIIVWIAILGLLIKLDVGGFGSSVMYPVFKDVPIINKILPENIDAELESTTEFTNLTDAIDEITRLRAEVESLKKKGADKSAEDEIASLKEEIKRLQTFEASQIDFQKLKTEFYEEVVFSENAPDVAEYQKFYEQIDPDNAEYIYRQVIKQIETDQEIVDYVNAYAAMKPKKAAAIFNIMTDNLDLVAKILDNMNADTRGAILAAMDAEVASQLTKLMDPDY